jgi:hypothetical protein
MKKLIIILIILIGIGVWYFYFGGANRNVVFSDAVLQKFKHYQGVDVCTYKGKKVIKHDSRSIDGSLYLYDIEGNPIGHKDGGMAQTYTESGNINEALIFGCTYVKFNK